MSESNPNPPSQTSANIAIDLDDDIQKIAQVELQTAPRDNDASLAERNALDLDRIKLELENIRQTQVATKEIHEIRKTYVQNLFVLIVCWLLLTAFVLTLAGFHDSGFTLSDKVLIALITSTTANVLGLFYVVAKWLYPAPLFDKSDKTDKTKAPQTPATRTSTQY